MATPAGWFVDPTDSNYWRYWDGVGWTTHVAPRTTGTGAQGPRPSGATGRTAPSGPSGPSVSTGSRPAGPNSPAGPSGPTGQSSSAGGGSRFLSGSGQPIAPDTEVAAPKTLRGRRSLAVVGAGAVALLASAGLVGAATGAFTPKALTDYDAVQWDQLPAWLADYEDQVAGSGGPNGAAVYSAIVTGRSITNTQEASIALSYTIAGDAETQSTSETLSLIEALQPEVCGQAVGESPQATLDRLLPNGTKVLVIDDKEGSGSAAFLHVIPPQAAMPAEEPPQGSVNEDLVATGTWIPNDTANEPWFQDPWANNGVQWTIGSSTSLSPTQDRYTGLILAAANDSWSATPQGQVCAAFRAEEERQEEEQRERDRLAAEAQLKAAAEAERQRQEAELLAQQEAERQRQAELAQQWTVPAPAPQGGGAGGSNYSYQPDTTPYGTPCGPGDRDGDGDGVCNESR